ncbi:MAG TPA: (d)CMP kinase [Deltaproteobacteria bacterium]|nr:(d)CMP kinase [Deltaproteobacteria bacterium]
MSVNHQLVVTIDGPAGSGKSTVGKALAEKISYVYLDTGALYRAVAYRAHNEKIMPGDGAHLSKLCNEIVISLETRDGGLRIIIDGDDVTDKIRTEEIGLLASRISAVPIVRESLLSIQREVGSAGGIVAEGRDMGTVVFPRADIKFYLVADVIERSRRRYDELIERGESVDFEEIYRGLLVRDEQDSGRSIAPLRAAEDAVIIDTTYRSIDEVVDTMKRIIEERCGNGA